jgi:hypothetical protein
MKSMHLLLSAALLMLITLWTRAAVQGLEQALLSTGVECCMKVLRAKAKAFSIINFLYPARISLGAAEHRIPRKGRW